MRFGLMIGQAASFAGLSVKAVRHYHRRGLIDEPRRDSSGYRRYESADLLRLVQVRTLAQAGVPLVRIRQLLDADPETFATALVEVEQRLTERIDELIARRATLHRLARGDRALLPERAGTLLDRMPCLGFTDEDAALARDGLVLVKAVVPEGFDDYLAQIENALLDRQYVELIQACWQARRLAPDDPRIDELAATVTDYLISHPSRWVVPTGIPARHDASARYSMLSHLGPEQSPTWARLTALIETRLKSSGIDLSAPFSPG